MTFTTEEVSDYYVRPCVNGNSSSGQYFNFSISVSSCLGANCTALNTQPGASIVSPILLSLTGISGQICALIYLHGSVRKSNQRTAFYVMLATLIWTDLIGKLVATPLPVLSYLKGRWIGGAYSCNLHGYSMSVIGIVTHLLVAVMALERYLGIRCGYFYSRNVTTSRTRRTLIGIWLFGLIFCSAPFLGLGEFKLHYPGTWCHINQHLCSDKPLSHKIFGNTYAAINLLCLSVMVFCNLIVVGTLLKMRVASSRPSKSLDQPPTRRPKDKEIQMVIVLVIITITFFFSWVAHDLLMIKNQLWPSPPNKNPSLDFKAIRLVSLNQIIDPWSYVICRIIFRSKIWKCCQRVFIGKLNARRLSRGEDGASIFNSIGLMKNKFGNKKDKNTNGHRKSLPNPNDIVIKIEQGKLYLPDCKNSLEHSCPSESDQGCFDPKSLQRSSLKSRFTKLFRSSKEDSYIQINHDAENNKNFGHLSPYTVPLRVPILHEDRNRTQNSSFHGGMKKVSSVRNCDYNEEQSHQLLRIRGFDTSASVSVISRSNSWCCPNEYTVRAHKA